MTSSTNSPSNSSFDLPLTAEERIQAIQFLESTINTRLKPSIRKIVSEALRIHYKEHRGITRSDLVEIFHHSETYAKKILYECQRNGILVPLEGHKQGRFNEYFIKTEIETFLERERDKKSRGKAANTAINNNDYHAVPITVIQALINEITERKPTFHKLMMHIQMLKDDSSSVSGHQLRAFDQDYNLLTEENAWITKPRNKAKVKSFKLEHKRSCTIQVYPNGKVIIALECSYRAFRLYEEDGSREFFEVIGKVSLILSQEFMQHSIIPPTGEWLLKQYDRDITIPESELTEKHPSIINWFSKEGIQLRTLGRTFQIYGKVMPVCRRCLRVEEKVGIREDVSIEQGIKDAVEQPFEISSAFAMLNKDDAQ